MHGPPNVKYGTQSWFVSHVTVMLSFQMSNYKHICTVNLLWLNDLNCDRDWLCYNGMISFDTPKNVSNWQQMVMYVLS